MINNLQNHMKQVEMMMKEQGKIILEAWNKTNQEFKDTREKVKCVYEENKRSLFKVSKHKY